MARARGPATRRTAPAAAARTAVPCAFCQGRGTDPFGLLAKRSACPVCLGKGVLEAPGERVRCAYCGARGVQPHTRLTCSSCGGKGFQAVPEPRTVCARCGGLGQAPASELHLPCPDCHGSGWTHARGG